MEAVAVGRRVGNPRNEGSQYLAPCSDRAGVGQQGRTMSFGGHLRMLRQEAGVSRAGLARLAGVPVSTLRHWENDRGFPGVPALLRLAEALGVPVERLAEGVEDPAGDESDTAPRRPRRLRES